MAINIYDPLLISPSNNLIISYIQHTIQDRKSAVKIKALLEKIDTTVLVVLTTCYYFKKIQSKNNQILKLFNSENTKKDKGKTLNLDDKFLTFVSLIIIVTKYVNDSVYSNLYWSYLCKINIETLNIYESQNFYLLEYKLVIDNKIMREIEDSLKNTFGGVVFQRKKKTRSLFKRFICCLFF